MKIAGIRAAIRVRTRRKGNRVDTIVTIEHLIPDPDSGGRARWRISTRPARLPPSEFDNTAQVNRLFSEQRGRAIRCVDLVTGTAAAAVAYHLDDVETLPVLLTEVAVRTDRAWTEISRGCVRILKIYLHELGSRLHRPSAVGCFAATELMSREYQEFYKFRRARVPSAWTKFGTIYLLQPSPSDDP